MTIAPLQATASKAAFADTRECYQVCSAEYQFDYITLKTVWLRGFTDLAAHAVHRVWRLRLLRTDGGVLVWPFDSAGVAPVAGSGWYEP